MQELKNIAIGIGGIGASEVANPVLSTIDASNVVQVIVQIVIGIAALIGMFKKNKK